MSKEEQIHDILLDCYDFDTGKLAVGKAERKLKALIDRIEAETKKQTAGDLEKTYTEYYEGKMNNKDWINGYMQAIKDLKMVAKYGIQETEK